MTTRVRIAAPVSALLMVARTAMPLCGLGRWTALLTGAGCGTAAVVVAVSLAARCPPRR